MAQGLVAVFYPAEPAGASDYDILPTAIMAMRAGLVQYEHKALGRFALLARPAPGWTRYPAEEETCAA